MVVTALPLCLPALVPCSASLSQVPAGEAERAIRVAGSTWAWVLPGHENIPTPVIPLSLSSHSLPTCTFV